MHGMSVNPTLLEMAIATLEKSAFVPPGQPAMDPAAGGAPAGGGMPMDPSMMGGAPAGGGMPMDPMAMGGGMPMDPSMMGGAPPAPGGAPGGMPGGMPGDGKPKKVDPAIIDAKLYQILKLQVLICGQLGISIPPELLLGVAPDPMAAQQAASSNQQLEAQSGQTTAGLPPGGAGGGAPGGEMPKTGEALDPYADVPQDVRIGSSYNPQALLETAMLADVTEQGIKQAQVSSTAEAANRVRALLKHVSN